MTKTKETVESTSIAVFDPGKKRVTKRTDDAVPCREKEYSESDMMSSARERLWSRRARHQHNQRADPAEG